MNIQLEALYHYLSDKEIKTEYFYSEDYKLITQKCDIFKKKNKVLPSIKFLFNNVNKLSDDSEQVDRVEDILYVVEKLKPELDSTLEINELLLDHYKKENIRGLTKELASALTKENFLKAETISNKINEYSKLQLAVDDFRKNDIKVDIKSGSSIKADLISSGFFPESHPSLSQIARGSLVSIIADTGYGKSVLVIQAVLEQYLAGHNTCYISYEMPKRAVLARMLSNLTSVPISEINEEKYSTDEAEKRLEAGRAVLEYEIDFEKAFKRVLKGKGFEDCKVRENYLKIIAIASAGDEGIEELPDNEEILTIIEEHKPDFITIDLISEVKIRKSLGSYETDLSDFARELNRLALKHSSVVMIVSQPSSSTIGGLIFPKYAKSLRSSASSNILIASTQEMLKDKLACVIVEKCRHNMRGVTVGVEQDFNYMRFNLLDEEVLRMEDFFAELAKDFKKKGTDK